MSDIVIGYGEIGQAVGDVIGDPAIDDLGFPETHGTFDVMHICFPYSENFVSEVMRYMVKYVPKHTVIYSTVPIGTTKQLLGSVHSPVEGKHPNLAQSIRLTPRWIGANTAGEAAFFHDYFKDLGIFTQVVGSSDYTEFLKLRSTAKYGINLAWTDYEAKVAKEIGMDFKLINEFDKDYNILYRSLDMGEYQRYILSPPNGKIGGHCVIPNAKLLSEQYPDELLTILKEYE